MLFCLSEGFGVGGDMYHTDDIPAVSGHGTLSPNTEPDIYDPQGSFFLSTVVFFRVGS